MDDGNRTDAAHGFVERRTRLVGLDATRLKSQQRRDRLQVVLHPVVDLANGRVLGHQGAVTAPDLGRIADENDASGVTAVLVQRDAAQRHDGAGVLDLGSTRCATRCHHRKSLVDRTGSTSQLGARTRQIDAHQIGRESQSVIRRTRVGAGEADKSLTVDSDESVADTRRNVPCTTIVDSSSADSR